MLNLYTGSLVYDNDVLPNFSRRVEGDLIQRLNRLGFNVWRNEERNHSPQSNMIRVKREIYLETAGHFLIFEVDEGNVVDPVRLKEAEELGEDRYMPIFNREAIHTLSLHGGDREGLALMIQGFYQDVRGKIASVMSQR